MKLLILGATGRTGKYLVQESLSRGHVVHALVREKSKIEETNANLHLFQGSPLDADRLAEAMSGCDAVLSVLNISRVSDFPWARLRTPDHFLSEAMQKVIEVAHRQNITRVVVCTAWGVHETINDIPWWFRWLIRSSNIGVTYKDHERQEDLLMHSDLDWTIVRPVGLTNSTQIKEITLSINNNPKPGLTISRLQVAGFMLTATEDHTYLNLSPAISG